MNAALAPTPWIHEQAGQTETVEQLIRRAMLHFADNGLSISPSKASRMVRAYVRNCGSVQIAARQLEAYCLSYADPTGETAVRNAMAGTR